MNRIEQHPILGPLRAVRTFEFSFAGDPVRARAGDTIAAALIARGVTVFRTTHKRGEPRNVFCAIGRCTDCAMTVDGVPNVRTCITPAKPGMVVRTQRGLGEWQFGDDRGGAGQQSALGDAD